MSIYFKYKYIMLSWILYSTVPTCLAQTAGITQPVEETSEDTATTTLATDEFDDYTYPAIPTLNEEKYNSIINLDHDATYHSMDEMFKFHNHQNKYYYEKRNFESMSDTNHCYKEYIKCILATVAPARVCATHVGYWGYYVMEFPTLCDLHLRNCRGLMRFVMTYYEGHCQNEFFGNHLKYPPQHERRFMGTLNSIANGQFFKLWAKVEHSDEKVRTLKSVTAPYTKDIE